MTLSATPLKKILQAVNEKYGTSFESWSQLPTVYEIGDTVPNWSAYEKIVQPITLVAIKSTGSEYYYWFGYIENGTYHYACNANGNEIWLVDIDSGSVQTSDDWDQSIENIIFQTMRSQYGVDNVVKYIFDVHTGDTIPNWDDYEKIDHI